MFPITFKGSLQMLHSCYNTHHSVLIFVVRHGIYEIKNAGTALFVRRVARRPGWLFHSLLPKLWP